jgi:hypothetical protein
MADWTWDTWLLVVSTVAFLGLAYSSAWLRGAGWYLATVPSIAVAIATISGGPLVRVSGIRFWAGALGALMLFGFFFYWVSARHITRTRMLDPTYGSHDALMRYIDERTLQTPLARTLRVLGPTLFFVVLALTVLAAAIQFKLTGDL